MEEMFSNKFVVEIVTGHPGFTNYAIISTPTGFRKMLDELQIKVEQIEKRLAADPQYKLSRQGLFSEYATLAPGETSRVYVSFEIDNDLEKYHQRPGLSKRVFPTMIFVIFIILAAVGLGSILRLLFW